MKCSRQVPTFQKKSCFRIQGRRVNWDPSTTLHGVDVITCTEWTTSYIYNFLCKLKLPLIFILSHIQFAPSPSLNFYDVTELAESSNRLHLHTELNIEVYSHCVTLETGRNAGDCEAGMWSPRSLRRLWFRLSRCPWQFLSHLTPPSLSDYPATKIVSSPPGFSKHT